jgi:hypothetical protein
MDRYAHLYPETRQAVAAILDGLIADAQNAENRTESNVSGPDADQTRFEQHSA